MSNDTIMFSTGFYTLYNRRILDHGNQSVDLKVNEISFLMLIKLRYLLSYFDDHFGCACVIKASVRVHNTHVHSRGQ